MPKIFLKEIEQNPFATLIVKETRDFFLKKKNSPYENRFYFFGR